MNRIDQNRGNYHFPFALLLLSTNQLLCAQENVVGGPLTRRMGIGIVPNLDPSGGGGHQYTMTVLDALGTLWQQKQEENLIVFVRPEDAGFARDRLKQTGWRQSALQPRHEDRFVSLLKSLVDERPLRTLGRLRRRVTSHGGPDPERIRRRSEFTRLFRRHGVDWVLYTFSNGLSFEAGVPYVMPVHDLLHRVHPEFREVFGDLEWEWREYLFRNGTRYATLILADSEVGKEDILEFYAPHGVTSDRIRVLPFLPPDYLATNVSASERARVRTHYHLPERYLFYPAQFSPDKNHKRIVQALRLLNDEEGAEIHVVLCGPCGGAIRQRTFEEVMLLARRLRVNNQVHYIGYAPEGDISGLYAEAAGLVMPTFCGPTNIPVLEAWACRCPVLTSDIRGIREQVGDAGLLVNPRSVPAIAEGIHRLWQDDLRRQDLAARGLRRLTEYTPQDFCRRLADVIEEANERVRGEGTFH